MLVASLLFSLAHLGNHLPPPSSAHVDETIGTLKETLREKNALEFNTKPFVFMTRFFLTFSPILLCLFQALLAGIISLHIFCPLYEQRGLTAWIGAHCTWDLFGYCLRICFYGSCQSRKLRAKLRQITLMVLHD
jgi:membrane protease YdiL (CAAX protease family)